jgi:hypothetical protein
MRTRNRKTIKKMLNLLLAKIFSFNLFMDPLNALLYDMVIRASASTYSPEQLRNAGLEITLNTANKKVRHIGDASNPVYPEVIVWRPDYPNSNTGQAVVVEAIETVNTIPTNIEKWRRLASLGIRFNLIIPSDQLAEVRRIIREQNIITTNLRLQTYIVQNGQYVFTTVPTT